MRKNNLSRIIYLSLVGIILWTGCQDQVMNTPKPRMYPRVLFPDRNYVSFEESYCTLEFIYPDYASIVQDTLFFDEKPIHPCWFDVVFTPFNGRLHCSYYPIESPADFDQLINDAFTFVDKHDIKANYRAETTIAGADGNGGMIFQIDGPVASPLQFFVTDSTNHFIRGSLYFQNKVNPDSMSLVHSFVEEDIMTLINSIRFK